jgi:hypothetical protein
MSRQKFSYVRSKKLMETYRMIPCQHCGADDGTVCGAHSNQSKHGKGRSIKASDEFVASLCSICHHQLDEGFLWGREEKQAMHEAAMAKTKQELVKRGLWPKEIPI